MLNKILKQIKVFKLFFIVLICCIGLYGFKICFQKDYTTISVNTLEQKIKNKETFVVTISENKTSNEDTYMNEIGINIPDYVNYDTIAMNKNNKKYTSTTRRVTYHNKDMYDESKNEKLNSLVADLILDTGFTEVDFSNLPVTMWIRNGKLYYAGVGKISYKNYKKITDGMYKNEDASKFENIEFKITETDTNSWTGNVDDTSTDNSDTQESDNSGDSNSEETAE